MKRMVSTEAREKMSAARKGHKDSPETLIKRKEAMNSPEVKARMSAVQIGNKNATGHHASEEGRAKMSVAKKGNKARLGFIASLETRAKLSIANWRGGSVVSGRKSSARHRLLGFIPLNSWFAGCEGHHINPWDVIHLPKKLHKSIYHNQHTGKGMAEMNVLAGAFLTEDWT